MTHTLLNWLKSLIVIEGLGICVIGAVIIALFRRRGK
jgi:hypothetical protein